MGFFTHKPEPINKEIDKLIRKVSKNNGWRIKEDDCDVVNGKYSLTIKSTDGYNWGISAKANESGSLVVYVIMDNLEDRSNKVGIPPEELFRRIDEQNNLASFHYNGGFCEFSMYLSPGVVNESNVYSAFVIAAESADCYIWAVEKLGFKY